MKIKTSHKENIVSFSLFYISLPLVYIFQLLKISPNGVTTLGNTGSLLAMVMLWQNGPSTIAFSFWLLSVLLYHADGALARATVSVRRL